MQPSVGGLIDNTHPAAAEFLDDLVVRNGLADHPASLPHVQAARGDPHILGAYRSEVNGRQAFSPNDVRVVGTSCGKWRESFVEKGASSLERRGSSPVRAQEPG